MKIFFFLFFLNFDYFKDAVTFLCFGYSLFPRVLNTSRTYDQKCLYLDIQPFVIGGGHSAICSGRKLF